jgi:hypothetical protein
VPWPYGHSRCKHELLAKVCHIFCEGPCGMLLLSALCYSSYAEAQAHGLGLGLRGKLSKEKSTYFLPGRSAASGWVPPRGHLESVFVAAEGLAGVEL